MGEEKQVFDQEFSDEAIANIGKIINRYYQEVTITKVNGKCPYGHKEGEKYRVTSMNHDGLCGSLYYTIHAPVTTLHYGGGIPWEKDACFSKGFCPEMGKVEVEVKRIKQETPTFVKTRADIKDMTGKGFPGLDKHRVHLEVISIGNKCTWGHKEGQRLEVDPFNIGKVCGFMYWEIYHFINLLFSGGSLPWEADENIIHGCCPDVFNQLTYRLMREER